MGRSTASTNTAESGVKSTTEKIIKKIDNPLEAMQPGEEIICEIRRHPMGMLSKYIATFLALVVLGVSAVLLIPQTVPQDSQSQARLFAIFGVVVVAVIAAIGLYLTQFIYYKNRWIVTSDSITQVSQTGLFSSQLSQLSMANLQDVTVVQDGIMPSTFDYGILRAETAGERSKFVFLYCPNPKKYAQKILMTREQFINTSPETAKRANDDLEVPRRPSDGLSVKKG
jgi:hypothetical protein